MSERSCKSEIKSEILERLAAGPMQRAMAREMARPRPDHVVSYVPVRGPRGWEVRVTHEERQAAGRRRRHQSEDRDDSFAPKKSVLTEA